jgi:hypothetical protein
MPSILMSVALVVCHVSVVDPPLSTVFGLALSEAVGAAAGGGGGGGGGATFFLQAPNVMMTLKANTSMIHFNLLCFNFSSLRNAIIMTKTISSSSWAGYYCRLSLTVFD